MTYKYDFKRFIESPALKEYLSTDMFTPGEQAVLISKSYQPIDEKIKALIWLKENHGEECYCPRPGCKNTECVKRKIYIKDLIDRTIAFWTNILNKRWDNKNVIFAANLIEKDFERDSVEDFFYFSDYEKAYAYIKERKDYYLADEELKDVITYGQILRIPLDNTDTYKGSSEKYYFDTNMNLYQMFSYMEDEWGNIQLRTLEDYFVYIPTPFKIGDVLKCDFGKAGDLFGEVDYDINSVMERRFEYACSRGDDSDSIVELAYYEKDEKRWTILDAHILNLSYATEEDKLKIPKYDGSPL